VQHIDQAVPSKSSKVSVLIDPIRSDDYATASDMSSDQSEIFEFFDDENSLSGYRRSLLASDEPLQFSIKVMRYSVVTS
jgi:hypothetical protein